MSLINREALLAEYDRVHVGPPGGARKLIEEAPEVKPKVVAEIKIDGETLQKLVDEVIEEIKAVQSDPDFVKVVRCRDCEYGESDEVGWYCRDTGGQMGPVDGTGFCWNGEKKKWMM